MAWYLQIICYTISLTLSFIALRYVDFNKWVKNSKYQTQLGLLIYILLSIALGAIVGWFLIEVGNLIAYH